MSPFRLNFLMLTVFVACCAFSGCGDRPADAPQTRDQPDEHPYLDLRLVREFSFTRDEVRVVPEGMVWAIAGHTIAEGRITTSDVLIDGRACIGDFEMAGKYWVTFQRLQSQTIWVYSGTKLGLGDTRPTLMIKEFQVLSQSKAVTSVGSARKKATPEEQ
jgi:hypothetical protein